MYINYVHNVYVTLFIIIVLFKKKKNLLYEEI